MFPLGEDVGAVVLTPVTIVVSGSLEVSVLSVRWFCEEANVSWLEVLKADTVVFPFPSDVSEVAAMTGVEAVVTDCDMASVSPTAVYIEGGAVILSDVARYVWLMLECDEVVASPEYDVS